MYRLVINNSTKRVLHRALQQQRIRQYHRSNGLPPNVQEAHLGKLIIILSPVIAVGGVAAYAKYDKDFRKKLEANVPGSATLIKIALLEEKPFDAFDISDQIASLRKQVNNSFDSLVTRVTSLFEKSSSAEKTKQIQQENAPKPTVISKVATTPPTKTPESKETSPAKPAVTTPSSASTVAVKAKPVTEELPNDLLELEHSAEIAASLAVKEYNKAIEILKSFNSEVRVIVDDAVEKVDPTVWTSLKNKTSARDTTVGTAEILANEALDKIERCKIALSKIANQSNEDQVLKINDKIHKLLEHIKKVKDDLYQNKNIAATSDKYWRNVEKARNYFVDELESIFPGINLSEKKLNISKEDLDLLILHAYSHVLAYQKEVQRLMSDGELRLKRAVDSSRGDNQSDAVKAQVEYLLEAEKRKLAIENQKKIFNIRAGMEKQLRQNLKQQAEAHVDHLGDAIALKEKELKRQFSNEYEDKLSKEKSSYKLQLASMLGKMRGMESALQVRAEAERSAHQAQALWAACHALWSAIRSGEAGANWKAKFRPLVNEIDIIAKVGDGDELVDVIIKNLPNEVTNRGVYPEDALRERFLSMERVARKVALVPEEGASIPMYVLSYLQSLFVLQPENPISEAELQNKKFDYSKLDTFDILNRARYFVDRGDLIQACRYVNLLQGYPRKVAREWLHETRLTLETQQAANTLMAHAAASGLLYL